MVAGWGGGRGIFDDEGTLIQRTMTGWVVFVAPAMELGTEEGEGVAFVEV